MKGTYDEIREHLCERCHRRHAVAIFDRWTVCAKCWRVLEQRLVKEATR